MLSNRKSSQDMSSDSRGAPYATRGLHGSAKTNPAGDRGF